MRNVTIVLVIVVLAPFTSTRAYAQGSSSVSTTEADSAYQAEDWPRATALYEQISEVTRNARVWYRLGTSRGHTGQNDRAIVAFEKGMAAGRPRKNGEYGIALIYALENHDVLALEHLRMAAEDGLTGMEQMLGEPAFDHLVADERFKTILEQIKKNERPCAYSPENRQFDFWLGDWSVSSSGEKAVAGTSKIELILGDCVLPGKLDERWQCRLCRQEL